MEDKIKREYRILSIDAWRGCDGGWEWNNWFHDGTIDNIPGSNRAILKMLREHGYLTEYSKGKVSIDDDGYNIIILNKDTLEPIFAIEYGNDETSYEKE